MRTWMMVLLRTLCLTSLVASGVAQAAPAEVLVGRADDKATGSRLAAGPRFALPTVPAHPTPNRDQFGPLR